jgi:TM2 domain-containing membrane protein YozV
LYCSKCGLQLNEGSAFCSRCGARVALVVEQAAQDLSPKSRLATSLLAIFLGWVGAHRFYTGKIGTAVVMLLIGVAFLICQFGAMFIGIASAYETEMPALWFLFWGLSLVFGAVVGIWALIDFIIAVTGNFKDSQGKIIKKW